MNEFTCERLCEVHDLDYQRMLLSKDYVLGCHFKIGKDAEKCSACRLKSSIFETIKTVYGPHLKSNIFYSPTDGLQVKKFCSEKCFTRANHEICRSIVKVQILEAKQNNNKTHKFTLTKSESMKNSFNQQEQSTRFSKTSFKGENTFPSLNINKQSLTPSCESSCKQSLIEAVDCREKSSAVNTLYKKCFKCIISDQANSFFDCEKCLSLSNNCMLISNFEFPKSNC